MIRLPAHILALLLWCVLRCGYLHTLQMCLTRVSCTHIQHMHVQAHTNKPKGKIMC